MKIRISLIGMSAIALESHLPALWDRRHIEIAALRDQRINSATKVASDFGVKKVHGDLKEMLLNERLDAPRTCTSAASHTSLSVQAIEAGCHVLIEKPIVSSIATSISLDRHNAIGNRKQSHVCCMEIYVDPRTLQDRERLVP